MLDYNSLKERLSNLLRKGEKYIVIEILNHYVQVTLLKISFKDKEITILKSYFKDLPEFSIANIFKEAKALLKKIPKSERYKIIISLDSSLGTTIFSSVSIVRQNSKEIIDEADLDNLISQAIWRFFDKQRWKVAQKMGVDDVDVLLSDVRIRDIRIDGHKIVNPIGFKAKSVEIALSQTLVKRELMSALRDLIPKENIALLTETGTALSHVLSKTTGDSNFYLANIFPNQTSVFSSSGARLAHHDSFEWGGNDLNHSLYRHLRVDPEIAVSLVKNYGSDNGSESFLRKFENILVKELNIFANGIESLTKEDRSDIYLNPFFTIPKVVYSPRFQGRFQKTIKLAPLSTELITEKLGYKVKFKSSAAIKNQLSLLAAVLEVEFLPQNDIMSRLANRRVRWLVN